MRLVLSLPIRNWNYVCVTNSLINCLGFEPTYKELKHPSPTLFIVTGCVLSLPIRNWNKEVKMAAQGFDLVLSLPIRNWNAVNGQPYVERQKCFEPTYKELKQGGVEWVGVGAGGFEPTYKELKPPFHCSLMPSSSRVLSLPIRNWNPVSPYSCHHWNSVLSLPIRNWNAIPPKDTASMSPVLSLPIRNWNSTERLLLAVTLRVLSLPIRNWNVSSCVTCHETKVGFWAYL